MAEQGQTALASTGLYEAAGLALWLQTGAVGTCSLAAEQPDVNWASLVRFKEAWFSKRASFKASVTRSQGQKKIKQDRARIIWPTEMICVVKKPSDATADHFDAGLPLLATGHFVLWSWYLALFEGLQSADPCQLETNKINNGQL